MDRKIKEFENQLIELINNAEIPAGAAYYILKDVLNKVQNVFQNNVIADQLQQQQQEEEEKVEQPQQEKE